MAKSEKKPSALQRALEAAIGAGRTVGLESDPAREKWPALWEWLTATGEGTEFLMQGASISINLGPEGVFASITHRDMGVTCSIAVLHLHEVFEGLDAALASPNPPIRTWGKTEPMLRKRRKK